MTDFEQSLIEGKAVIVKSFTDTTSGTINALASANKANICLTNASTLNGVVAGPGGQILYIENATGTAITVNQQSISASVGNRISTGTGSNYSLLNKSTMQLIYSDTNTVWEISSAGAQGAQGFQGLTGVQGAQGSQGIQGSTGPQGTQGFQGPQGLQGSTGVQGSQGSQGSQGNSGNALSSPLDLYNMALAFSFAANALTLTLNDASGATPSSGSPVKIAFGNNNTAIANYTDSTATASTTLTIPSGATLGQASGISENIYVYAINNAGTIELAVSTTSLSEQSGITTVAISAGATSRTVMYSTTARSGTRFRLLAKFVSNQATAGTWVTNPSLFVLQPLDEDPAPSRVTVNTGNGYGSSSTKIRRWSTIFENTGSDITYADSSTLGGSFTINTAGLYFIYCSDSETLPGDFAITKNESTNVPSSAASGNILSGYGQIGANVAVTISGWATLVSGDVVRLNVDTSGTPSTSATKVRFGICGPF